MKLATTTDRPTRLDPLQLGAVLCLMLLSVMFVYSATMTNETTITRLFSHTYIRQFVWCVLGLGAAGAVCLVDYHVICRWSFVAYWIAILLLIAVLIPGIGKTHDVGARRWIDLPFFQFQPSEFAKLAFILAQAHYLSRPPDELRLPAVFWKAIGLLALPFLLIVKEPDLGSGLVLVPTGLVMLAVAGTPLRYLGQLVGLGALLVVLLLGDLLYAPPNYRIKMKEYQVKRLLVYFGINYVNYSAAGADAAEQRRVKEEQEKDEYNVKQAMIAVGSGGMWGKGWRHGQQNYLGYVPRAGKHNDFIFCVIAEELGFFGSLIVLGLYSVILFTGIRIAGQARDRLGKLLAAGVVTLLFSHIFINIGMNIRIMPVTGIPLPLLSYGGSSVLGSMIAIGLLQNIYMYRKAY